MEEWVINKEQYKKLLYYIGSGDLQNADIIIFGNEEGSGGNPIYANIEARANYYGKKEGEDSYAYTIDPNGNYEKGFWNPSAIVGEQIVFKIMKDNNEKIPTRNFTKGGFLQYCSRICLAIEESQNNIDFWFELIGKNKEAAAIIRKYIRDGLFQSKEGINTFLMDWRPLPRPNQKWWENEYSEVIDKKSYLDAFKLNHPEKNYKDSFSDYSEDVNIRKEVFKNAILFSKAKVLIGLGDVDTKKTLIREILGLSDGDFTPINIEGTNVKSLLCEKIFDENGKKLSIFLLPFPLSGQGAFENGEEMNKFYKEITNKIKTILNNN